MSAGREYHQAWRERNRDQVRATDLAYYERNRERVCARKRQERRDHPDKAAARSDVSNALKDGRLERQPCEECGTTEQVQAHHEDYSKPLDVRWLCKTHHTEVHL